MLLLVLFQSLLQWGDHSVDPQISGCHWPSCAGQVPFISGALGHSTVTNVLKSLPQSLVR
jgi:hypothetical protein